MKEEKLSMQSKVHGLDVLSVDALPTKVYMKASWKRVPLKVRVLLVMRSPLCTACHLKVAFLGIGAQSRW